MSKLKKSTMAGLAAVAVAGLAFGVTAPASAEPTEFRPLVATGSDTIQDVSNGLGTVVADALENPVLASYNATNPSTGATYDDIQTRLGGVLFDRPNGSTDGLRALSASENPGSFSWRTQNIAGQVDIARVSSAPTLTTVSNLAYVPFGLDAVTVAVHEDNTVVPRNIPLGTVVGQDTDNDGIRDLTLKNIYGLSPATTNGTFTLEAGATTYTVGNQASAAQIVPFQPQASSGTRQFWATTITGSSSGAFGSHVLATYNAGANSVQEHDGSVLDALPTRAIVPFSAAQWIAQGNSLPDVTDRRHGAELLAISGSEPTIYDEISETYVLNEDFVVTREVYYVASNARLTDTTPDASTELLQNFLIGGSGATEWVCNYPLTIQQYGFGLVDDCGTITGYRPFTS